MMQSCAALIFDVDGTLADTEELHRQAFNQAFKECRLGWSWDVPLYGELLEITNFVRQTHRARAAAAPRKLASRARTVLSRRS